jgi:hypothetical protein
MNAYMPLLNLKRPYPTAHTTPRTNSFDGDPVERSSAAAVEPSTRLPQLARPESQRDPGLLARVLLRLCAEPSSTAAQQLARTMSDRAQRESGTTKQEFAAHSAFNRHQSDLDGRHVSSESDRRTFPRRESGSQVSICRERELKNVSPERISWMLHSSRIKGRLVDISRSGVAFVCPNPIDVDENLWLRISNPTFSNYIDVPARVVRQIFAGNGRWKVNCRFSASLTFEEVHAFGHERFASRYV